MSRKRGAPRTAREAASVAPFVEGVDDEATRARFAWVREKVETAHGPIPERGIFEAVDHRLDMANRAVRRGETFEAVDELRRAIKIARDMAEAPGQDW